ncbi:hypothetical protein AJ87_13010 [Rhizobium yanglingense]|nr:hypothetical protein AJ87_13010 [Rhizobium yanglingense]
MLCTGVGILAEVGRGEIGKLIAHRLPMLHLGRIATSASCTAKVRIALIDLLLGGAVLRKCYRSKSEQQHDRRGGSNNAIHSTSMRVIK